MCVCVFLNNSNYKVDISEASPNEVLAKILPNVISPHPPLRLRDTPGIENYLQWG